jgi:hypothetical protein
LKSGYLEFVKRIEQLGPSNSPPLKRQVEIQRAQTARRRWRLERNGPCRRLGLVGGLEFEQRLVPQAPHFDGQ